MHLAGGIGGLELDPHDCSVMKQPAALTRNGSCRWLTWPAHELRCPTGKLLRFLVALFPVAVLLFSAKYLFGAATVAAPAVARPAGRFRIWVSSQFQRRFKSEVQQGSNDGMAE